MTNGENLLQVFPWGVVAEQLSETENLRGVEPEKKEEKEEAARGGSNPDPSPYNGGDAHTTELREHRERVRVGKSNAIL